MTVHEAIKLLNANIKYVENIVDQSESPEKMYWEGKLHGMIDAMQILNRCMPQELNHD